MDFTIEEVYIPEVCQQNLLNALGDKGIKQKDIPGFYADCIKAGQDGIDWPLINAAVSGKWSRTALLRIKAKAWKLLGQ